ncbi:2771_t:CDS:1, partial [Gigaspora margarita]
TSEIKREDQEELLENSNEAENVPEDNDSIFSIASSSSSSDNDDDLKKKTDKND